MSFIRRVLSGKTLAAEPFFPSALAREPRRIGKFYVSLALTIKLSLMEFSLIKGELGRGNRPLYKDESGFSLYFVNIPGSQKTSV